MYRAKTILLALSLATVTAIAAEPPAAHVAAGRRALDHVRTAVEFGPRPAGSAAQAKQQAWILDEMKSSGASIEELDFTAFTPLGPKRMKNIIAKFDGAGDRVVVVSGHYDTYRRTAFPFVGANDGGSSTGLLLSLAEMLKTRPLQDDVWLVFFDGEEATVAWQGMDHTYGSRKQADAWQRSGASRSIKALINVDMIGDADLSISYEGYSTPWLRDLLVSVAHRLGYQEEFQTGPPQYIADDHVEFAERGIPAADLIDFDYGPGNEYWHQETDTVDKLSARSFAVVLHVLDTALTELAKRP